MRRFLSRLLLTSTLLLAAGAAQAASIRYELDPVHTRVMFAVDHAGFSKALGTVSGTTGNLLFDPQHWQQAQLEVNVPLLRLDLGDERWNRATLARKLLNGERYPLAHFISSRVEPLGENHARVYGTLTLHGVSREISLEVTLNALKRHPLPPYRRTAGFSATTSLSRADFGIDAWPSVIGDQVELRIEAEAVRVGKANDADNDSDAQSVPGTDTDNDSTANAKEATS